MGNMPMDHMAASGPSTQGAATGQAPAPAQIAASTRGDPAAGRLVFRKCQACHSTEPGKNILGPSLAGVIGRKAGTEANYNYSPAMKQANIVWDANTIDQYLADPAKVVPGNKMPFPGHKTDNVRADVIAFLAAPAAASPPGTTTAQQAPPTVATPPQQPPSGAAPQSTPGTESGYVTDAKYTLRSGIAEGRMVYIGVGGAIEGKANPILTAAEGQVVELTLINGEGAEHDIVFPD